jgi:hypothetical protein
VNGTSSDGTNGNESGQPANWTNTLNNSTYGRGQTSPQPGILVIQYPIQSLA